MQRKITITAPSAASALKSGISRRAFLQKHAVIDPTAEMQTPSPPPPLKARGGGSRHKLRQKSPQSSPTHPPQPPLSPVHPDESVPAQRRQGAASPYFSTPKPVETPFSPAIFSTAISSSSSVTTGQQPVYLPNVPCADRQHNVSRPYDLADIRRNPLKAAQIDGARNFLCMRRMSTPYTLSSRAA